MKCLIICDNQEITSAGILYLVDDSLSSQNINVLHATKKAELTTSLLNYPDAAVILDYTLFDFYAPDEVLILSERYPLSSWMLFSDDLSDSFLRFISANDLQFSIVLKSCSLEEIKLGLNSVLTDNRYICERTKAHLQTLHRASNEYVDHNLTNTEKEVLKEIALGKTTKEIASDRFLSFHTVITHRKNIFRKLGVNNVHEATKYAFRAGIVDMSEYYI